MFEVEVKVRANHGAVREKLAALDAERLDVVHQTDVYYGAPHRDFSETDEALRVRRETDPNGAGVDEPTVTKVTYKGPLVEAESKTREEHETTVDDVEAMEGILAGLGFEPSATVEKERERYAVDGYVVTLDRVTDLGEFLEVESEADEAGIEVAREGAFEVLRTLGLDPADQIRTSYLGLLLTDDTDVRK